MGIGVHGGASTSAGGGLTDTELRATPVPVSGTVTTSASSDVVSTLNSSTANLLLGTAFTGTYEDVSAYSSLSIFAESDVGPSSSGIQLQWSHDSIGTAVVQSDLSSFASHVFTAPIVAKYFRVKYNNGGSNQTRFALQTIFHRTASAPPVPFSLGTTDNTVVSDPLTVPLTGAVGLVVGTTGKLRYLKVDANGAQVISAPLGLDINSIAAGTALIGKVGIDQTTPGTTNKVSLASDIIYVVGIQTHNNAAPGAFNMGTLPAIATAAVPSYTQGNQVGLSTDLAGILRANPSTAFGKTLTFVPVAQGSAGTTQLAAADAAKKHKVMGCILTMSVAGTLKFLDSSGDLTGAMDVATTGGFVLPTSMIQYTETGAVNRSISITTTTGAAKGVVVLLTEA